MIKIVRQRIDGVDMKRKMMSKQLLLLCALFGPLKLELFAQGGDIPDGGQVIFLDLVLSRNTQIHISG